MKSLIFYCTALFLCCGSFSSGSPGAPRKIRVLASFSILADLAREIGGERVHVDTLVPLSADPHVYEPRPSDIKKIRQADIVLVNGLGFEGWIERLIKASRFKKKLVVVSTHVHPRLVFENTLIHDPHAWHSVPNAKIYVTNILSALVAQSPSSGPYFTGRAQAYQEKLTALDKYIRHQIDRIAPSRRKIITGHDAFGYFGNTYGVQFLAPKGISTDAEPKVRNIIELIKQIKKFRIKYIFIENIADPKVIYQISKETGAQIGGVLYSDALSGPDGGAPDYLTMMRTNVNLFLKSMV